jgi:hypothetical protein
MKILPFQQYLVSVIKFILSNENWLAPNSTCFYPLPKQADSAPFITPVPSIAFTMFLKFGLSKNKQVQ